MAWPAPFVGRFSLDLLFDPVKRGDALHGLSGDRRLVRLHQIKKVAPYVGHAWSFLNRSTLIQLIKAGECVRLKDALELG
jgi:hypothetical protein